MGTHEFVTSQEAELYIRNQLGIGAEASDALAEIAMDAGLLERVPVRGATPPGGAPAMINRFRWVIRDDDLALFDAIFDGVKTSASAGFFMAADLGNPAFWGAVVGVTATLFKLGRNVVRKGRTLDAQTFAVLAAVKASSGITSTTLAERLGRSHDEVLVTLESLKSLPMKDGVSRQLVAKNEHGQWVPAGV